MSDRHHTIPRTTCFVFNDKQETLLIEFSEEKGKMAGFHDPPGGHIEKGEGIIANSQREIKEESGLEVGYTELKGVVHVSNFFGKEIMLFVTASYEPSGKLKASSEGTPKWVAIEEINTLKIFPDIKLMLDKMEALPAGEVFTATSEFDDDGELKRFDFE